MTDNGQKIIDLDRKRMNAMAVKDFATLNAFLSDDLVYTHSTARIDTEKSLIEAMESGERSIRGRAFRCEGTGPGHAVSSDRLGPIHVMSNGKPNIFGVRFTDATSTTADMANGGLAVHPPSGVRRPWRDETCPACMQVPRRTPRGLLAYRACNVSAHGAKSGDHQGAYAQDVLCTTQTPVPSRLNRSNRSRTVQPAVEAVAGTYRRSSPS